MPRGKDFFDLVLTVDLDVVLQERMVQPAAVEVVNENTGFELFDFDFLDHIAPITRALIAFHRSIRRNVYESAGM